MDTINTSLIIISPPHQFAKIDDVCLLFRKNISINKYNFLITYAYDNNLWNEIYDEVTRKEQGWLDVLYDTVKCLI
jgi:hypothetical protein